MPEKKKPSGAPPWMATFADLSTLLMTFFVLLLSFSSMDVQKFRDMLGSVQEAFGVQIEKRGQFQAVIEEAKPSEEIKPDLEQLYEPPPTPPQTASQEAETARESVEMAGEVEKLVKESQLSEDVDVLAGPRGVRLRAKGGLFFQPGEANLKETSFNFLDGLGKVMKKSKFYLIIEGHTDNQPISNAVFPSNWELSSARATAVVRYLNERVGLPPTRLAAIGFGPYYPVASNGTPEGRHQNRRVEFIFTKLSPRVAVK